MSRSAFGEPSSRTKDIATSGLIMAQRRQGHVIGFALIVLFSSCQAQAPGEARRSSAKIEASKSCGRQNQKDQADMAFVPPGEFLMGSDADDSERICKIFGWNTDEKQL